MKSKALILILILGIAGCVSEHKPEPAAAPIAIKTELNRIEVDINTNQLDRAIKRLEKVIAQHPHTDASSEAYVLLGRAYYKKANYTDSYKAYLAVMNSAYSSPRELDAVFGAALSLYKLGRYDEALNLTNRVLKQGHLPPAALMEVYTLRYNLQAQLGDRLDALRSLVFLVQNAQDKEQREKYRIKAYGIIESGLREEELKTIANDSTFGFVRGQALFRVALTFFEQRDYSKAESYFDEVIKALPGSDLAQSAQGYVDQISARQRVAPFTIGAVLPLSGKYAQMAQKTLRGLQMGLGLYDPTPTDFKLAVIDSEANPDLARRAVERLVIEDSVVAIVGDLLSKTAEPVAQKADELGVPVIGLSQKSGLTQIGQNVFRNALTSEALVHQLVQSAMNVYGMRRFAILYPNDPYGIEYANLFWDEVLASGGQITAAQIYSPTERDFGSAVSRLVGTYYNEDRADEYTARLKEWWAQQKTITSRVTPPSDLLPPIVDFDGVFIPDGVKALGQIASMLVYNDVKNVRLLGTNLWNSPTLVERGTTLIENSLFVDAKSSIDNSLQNSDFSRAYKKLFNEDPTAFEAQAYDTGLALRDAISRGVRSRVALREALQNMTNFHGTTGDIDVTPDREFTRPLSVLTVTGGKISLANPNGTTPAIHQ